MELIFTILAGLGALLFLVGYLGFVFAGFKHHFVTGLISALPVLNIVTIPALWRNASRKVIISAIGLIIIGASWFLGANTGVTKYISSLKKDNQTVQTSITTPLVTTDNIPTSHTQNSLTSNIQQHTDDSKFQALPKTALYRMSFELIPVDKIQGLKNRIVKIITTRNTQLEGQVESVNISSIVIDGSELPIANIKQISLMVKKVR